LIYGQEIPLLLLLQYASVRHTEGFQRVKLHKEIASKVTAASGWTDGSVELNEWMEKFEHWFDVFIARMGRQYPHVFKRAKPPKEVYGIPVAVSTSWKCKICGYHTITTEAPQWLPCWKAVWNFYAPAQGLKPTQTKQQTRTTKTKTPRTREELETVQKGRKKMLLTMEEMKGK